MTEFGVARPGIAQEVAHSRQKALWPPPGQASPSLLVQENVQDVPWPQDLFRVDPRCSDPEQLREWLQNIKPEDFEKYNKA